MSSQIRSSSTEFPSTQPVWLFAAFASDPEQIYFAASYDLHDWLPLGRFVADGPHVAQGARDPQHIFYRGRWYCSYTQSHHAEGIGTTFGIAVSDDLIHWDRLCDIDLMVAATGRISGSQRIWEPLLALDSNGLPYIIVMAADEGKFLFLRPSDPADLTTFAFKQFVVFPTSPGSPTIASTTLLNGSYYVQGPDGAAGQGVYTASQPQGPYTYLGAITGISNESLGLTYDSGIWYSFDDTDQAYPLSRGTPQWRTNLSGPTGIFSPVHFSEYQKFAGSLYGGSGNPRVIRYYGHAALSIRAAMEQVVSQAQPSHAVILPVSNHSYAVTNGAAAADDPDPPKSLSPILVSGTTNGAKASVTLIQSPFFESNRPFLAVPGRLLDFQCSLYLGEGASETSPARVLFGVKKDHLGELDNAGVGLRFFQDAGYIGGGRIELIVHDGTSLTIADTGGFNHDESLCLRVTIDGSVMSVWLNGTAIFRYYDVPVGSFFPPSKAGALDGTYNAIVFQQDFVSGGNCISRFFGGSLKQFWK